MEFCSAVLLLLRGLLVNRLSLAAENLALRQQLAAYHRTAKRPKLRNRDRFFWVCLSRLWTKWRSALVLVQPATVVKWHRAGFRLYWRWKSRSAQVGRPQVEREIRDLIRRMARENPTWGAPRIQSELRLVGHEVAESTVARYLFRKRTPPSPTWRTFLDNHLSDLVGIDFFTVPTATFRVLYCFIVLAHDRRKVLHFHVTPYPSAKWTAQQLVEAFPCDQAPRFLIRDNDSIYGDVFQRRVQHLGIEEILTAYRSPWQNPYAERVIGSIRRECLDYMIVLHAAHLRRIVTAYLDYYHNARTHLSLERNAPLPRTIETPACGHVRSLPMVGGLHHRYTRRAA